MRQDAAELRQLLALSPWNTRDSEPAVLAAQYGTVAIMESLLRYGWDVNARDAQFDQALLSWSCKSARPDLSSLLLSHGADPNHIDRSGHPALVWAATGKTLLHLECASLLINAGANIDLGMNTTALMTASAHGSAEIVNELVKHGADVNLQRPNGSALTHAIHAGRSNIVKLLLTLGAKACDKLKSEATNRTAWIGFDAVEIARHLKREQIVELLENHDR